MATMTSREFNRDVSAAKREADQGPLTITDRGTPAYVLMTVDEYRRITSPRQNLLARLQMDDRDDDVDFEPLNVGLQVPEL